MFVYIKIEGFVNNFKQKDSWGPVGGGGGRGVCVGWVQGVTLLSNTMACTPGGMGCVIH